MNSDIMFGNAEIRYKEAKEHVDSDKNICVRNAQEAFELYLKTSFKLLGLKYDFYHNINEVLLNSEFMKFCKEENIQNELLTALLRGNEVLLKWREISFYSGDKKITDLIHRFVKEEATLALYYAESAMVFCNIIRGITLKRPVSIVANKKSESVCGIKKRLMKMLSF